MHSLVFIGLKVARKIYVSQGSVASQLRCGDIFSNHFFYKCFAECAGEKLSKSVKIRVLLFGSPCMHLVDLESRAMCPILMIKMIKLRFNNLISHCFVLTTMYPRTY